MLREPAIAAEELVVWSARAKEPWYDVGYDHIAWFFGAGQIQPWAGRSIGFEMARDFLLANPERKPWQLLRSPRRVSFSSLWQRNFRSRGRGSTMGAEEWRKSRR